MTIDKVVGGLSFLTKEELKHVAKTVEKLLRKKKFRRSSPRIPLQRFVNKLVRNATPSELLFKSYLEEWGIEFDFQKPVNGYIPDFCIHRLSDCPLLVEIDGSYHFTNEQMIADSKRQRKLIEAGHTVLRFTNEEVRERKNSIFIRLQRYHPKHVSKTA